MDISEKLVLCDPDYLWSYSRIKSFSDCPYGWWLKYMEGLKEAPRFYSQYGTFMHKIIEKYLKGEIGRKELTTYYISYFVRNVTERPQTPQIFTSYFKDGLTYLSNAENLNFGNVKDVEKRVRFDIDGIKILGFIDLVVENEDGTLSIIDHKSKKGIKPRNPKRRTKNDDELDEMYRQLYLYSNAFKDGNVKDLTINSFRQNCRIKDEFDTEQLRAANEWVVSEVAKIKNNDDWSPNIDFFHCKYICGLSEQCEYYQFYFGKG